MFDCGFRNLDFWRYCAPFAQWGSIARGVLFSQKLGDSWSQVSVGQLVAYSGYSYRESWSLRYWAPFSSWALMLQKQKVAHKLHTWSSMPSASSRVQYRILRYLLVTVDTRLRAWHSIMRETSGQYGCSALRQYQSDFPILRDEFWSSW